MHPLDVQITLLHAFSRRHPPQAATSGSAGTDLRACIDAPTLIIGPGQRAPVPTGVAICIGEAGYAGFLYSRSGLGAKKGLTVAQGVGLIDPDYRGEIIAMLLNTSTAPITIERGERIVQLVFAPYRAPRFAVTDALDDTQRGSGGFGHTGSR